MELWENYEKDQRKFFRIERIFNWSNVYIDIYILWKDLDALVQASNNGIKSYKCILDRNIL